MVSTAYYPKTTLLYSMRGRDARDFLHRLTTVNTRDMQVGDFKSGFFLNPQGKIRAHFRIACESADSFLFEVEGGRDGHWGKEFLAVIDQFTFAEEFKLEEKTGLKNAWIFAQPKARENVFEAKDALLYFHGSREEFGATWTSVWGPANEVDAFIAHLHSEVLSDEEFERRRILALAPGVDRELVPEANPLELGLRSSIDDNKGCYPGQEVIEKIISLGSPAKRLVQIESSATIAVGTKFFLEDGKSEVGVASSAIRDGSHSVALALFRKNALEVGKSLKLENGSIAVLKEIRGKNE